MFFKKLLLSITFISLLSSCGNTKSFPNAPPPVKTEITNPSLTPFSDAWNISFGPNIDEWTANRIMEEDSLATGLYINHKKGLVVLGSMDCEIRPSGVYGFPCQDYTEYDYCAGLYYPYDRMIFICPEDLAALRHEYRHAVCEDNGFEFENENYCLGDT